MLIPYQTDAPLYHWPIATVGLIAVNVVVFAATLDTGMGPDYEQIAPWVLEWGNGLHPLQWVSSNFLHADILHLLGNMFWLWGFGLIVEGKIGCWRFLGVYMGIAIVQCAVEQTMTLGMDGGGSLGASAAIFGIMMIALVWAPKNEVSCVLLIYFRPFHFECTLLVLGGVCLVIEIIIWNITFLATSSLAEAMTSAVLHLMGAALGLAVGVVMLKKDWVDCEKWDIFSVWAGKNLMSEEELDRLSAPAPPAAEELQQRRETALKQIRQIVADGNPVLAYRAHQKMIHSLPRWQLPESDFLKLIAAYQQQQLWSESLPVMVEYLRKYREHEAQVRLKLALVLVEKEGRPVQALHVLAKIRAEALSEKQRTLLSRLQRKAEKLKHDNPYEAVADDW